MHTAREYVHNVPYRISWFTGCSMWSSDLTGGSLYALGRRGEGRGGERGGERERREEKVDMRIASVTRQATYRESTCT